MGSVNSLTTTTTSTSTTNNLQNNLSNNSSNASNGGADDTLSLSINDVADLLHPQYAIISGGKSRDGCPIITFPDHNNFQTLPDNDYQKLIMYLTGVPTLQEVELGFNLIIDRRKDRWASVKAILFRISGYFPGIIHIVYVIRPSGFFQKAISEVSSKFFKDEFKFRVIICSAIDDLYEHIDRSQTTQDLGGDLIYSHHEWIQQRISLEKFSTLTHQITCNLDSFMRSIHDTEFPNSVDSTQKLLDDQGHEYDKMKDEILSAAKHGEQLLGDFNVKDENGVDTSNRKSTIEIFSTERKLLASQSQSSSSSPPPSSWCTLTKSIFITFLIKSIISIVPFSNRFCIKSSISLNQQSSSPTTITTTTTTTPVLKCPSSTSSPQSQSLFSNLKTINTNCKLFQLYLHTMNVMVNDDSRDYRRLLLQLEETERRFDDFWQTHLLRLKQCLELRRFEQDFRELQINFDSHQKTVSEMTEIGETVTRVDALIKETKVFQKICNGDIERAEEVVAIGQQLISARGACPIELVQPKCDELSRVCEILSGRLARRLEILLKSRDLMERVEKANKWCARGIELLASQKIEKCSLSAEIADKSLQEIQQFIATASEFRVSSPREFRNVFEESTTPETKALVSQVLQRIDDVSHMCDKRIVCLKKLALKPPRPVQQVIPEPAVPLQPPGGAPPLIGSRRIANKRMMDDRPRSMEVPLDSGISINGDTISSPDSDNSLQHIQNQSDLESRRLKRGHVLAELLDTERIYVAEMGSILKGYRDLMFSDEMAPLVQSDLQGKEDILFGNLHELYTFHNDIFLKDLENCISTTELVALCFVQRRDTFYRLYSFYCQNIPRSERLRETLVESHLFLVECQRRLGHKLPLAAYLLKPVQRITKYQLLLKDLLRFSDSGTCTRELQKALDCMLIVLKCVNDSMHQIAITGFPADLTQQGELLLQDSFQVWTESKKDIRLRLKTQQRHIFLYQKAMLFCKQASKTNHNKSTYQFKHYLKMSQIGLTESVRGDSKRFEVWLQGRLEVHTIQAPSIDIKNKWVSEIKKVLLNQLEELKDEKIKQYGLNHRPLRQTVSWDTPAMSAAMMQSSIANHGHPQRTISCDTNDMVTMTSSNRCSTNSGSIDEVTMGLPAIIQLTNANTTTGGTTGTINGVCTTTSSSDHDNHEAGAWSSDYSNSEDEFTNNNNNHNKNNEDNVTPGCKFVSLADYCAIGHSEISLKEGDTIELLKIGCAGWWFVKILGNNVEGWAPAAYLEPIHKKTSSSSSRRSSRILE